MLETPLENVDILTLDGRRVVLVGTAHVSQASVELVRQVIEAEKPSSIAVELCEPRLHALKDPERWRNTDVLSALRQGKGSVLLLQLLLAGFQKKLSKKLGVQPGAEMLEAVTLAETHGATLVLADREVRTTLKRVWAGFDFLSLCKLSMSLGTSILTESKDFTAEEIERLKTTDALEEALAQFSKEFPGIKKTLIEERDRYLAQKIRSAPGETIVAVVGAGHIPGIKSYIVADQDISPLDLLPPPSLAKRILGWALPLVVIGMIVYGFFSLGGKASGEMISTWFWVNGLFAATGALVALAHPLSILAALFAAPFTSLHPLLASGWASGIVEAIVHKPRVADLQSLSDDITTVRGWWRNRVSKVLLVMALTNLFGTVGTITGTWLVAKQLSGH